MLEAADRRQQQKLLVEWQIAELIAVPACLQPLIIIVQVSPCKLRLMAIHQPYSLVNGGNVLSSAFNCSGTITISRTRLVVCGNMPCAHCSF